MELPDVGMQNNHFEIKALLKISQWELVPMLPGNDTSNSSLYNFYQELLKENSNPRLKGNRKGIIVKGKEFYIPILNTFPTR